MNELRIATRRSALALAQARRVADLLSGIDPRMAIRFVGVVTRGDRDPTGDITMLSEIGAFVNSVRAAVLDGSADLAVHSLKDLPVSGRPEGLDLFFPERAAPLDVLVGRSLDELDAGSVVGTGSPRRSAQIRQIRPDIETVGLRGNVDTRLRKVEEGIVDSALLAEAGLERLGMADRIVHRFSIDQMVPAPGQGAIAVETRAGSEASELASGIDDPSLRPLLTAERRLLGETGAGCRAALGALASWAGKRMRLDLFVDDSRGPRRATVEAAGIESLVSAGRRELGL